MKRSKGKIGLAMVFVMVFMLLAANTSVLASGEEVTISGTVTIEKTGEVLETGWIEFNITPADFFGGNIQDGQFNVNVPPGVYDVRVDSYGKVHGSNIYIGQIEVTDQDIALDIELNSPSQVIGKITDTDTGEGLENATVTFNHRWISDIEVTTDADGYYTLDSKVFVGEFDVTVTHPDYKEFSGLIQVESGDFEVNIGLEHSWANEVAQAIAAIDALPETSHLAKDQIGQARELVDTAMELGAEPKLITNLDSLILAEMDLEDWLYLEEEVIYAEEVKTREAVAFAREDVEFFPDGEGKVDLLHRLDRVLAQIVASEQDWTVDQDTEVVVAAPDQDGNAKVDFGNSKVRMTFPVADGEEAVVSASRRNTPSEDGSISVPDEKLSSGIFLKFNRTANLVGVSIRVEVDYDPAELPQDLDPSTLELYRYNEETGEWDLLPNQGVNTDENYIWVELDNFSTFGAFATPESSEPAEELPKTGTNIYIMLIVGALMVIGGSGIMFINRKVLS